LQQRGDVNHLESLMQFEQHAASHAAVQ
jgi:hypothetical protein